MVNLPRLIMVTNYKALERVVHSHFYKVGCQNRIGNKRFRLGARAVGGGFYCRGCALLQ